MTSLLFSFINANFMFAFPCPTLCATHWMQCFLACRERRPLQGPTGVQHASSHGTGGLSLAAMPGFGNGWELRWA